MEHKGKLWQLLCNHIKQDQKKKKEKYKKKIYNIKQLRKQKDSMLIQVEF